MFTTHLHLVLMLRMSGAIPLLLYMPLWCEQGKLLLDFPLCLFLLSVCCRVELAIIIDDYQVELAIIIDDYQNGVQLGYFYFNTVHPFVSLK